MKKTITQEQFGSLISNMLTIRQTDIPEVLSFILSEPRLVRALKEHEFPKETEEQLLESLSHTCGKEESK